MTFQRSLMNILIEERSILNTYVNYISYVGVYAFLRTVKSDRTFSVLASSSTTWIINVHPDSSMMKLRFQHGEVASDLKGDITISPRRSKYHDDR